MNKSKIEKLIPEPQPNSSTTAAVLPSALLAQNPLLADVAIRLILATI